MPNVEQIASLAASAASAVNSFAKPKPPKTLTFVAKREQNVPTLCRNVAKIKSKSHALRNELREVEKEQRAKRKKNNTAATKQKKREVTATTTKKTSTIYNNIIFI